MPTTTPLSALKVPAWVRVVRDTLDHYHGHNWSSGVMPNNYLFFVRDDPEAMVPASVTHSLHHRYELVVAYAGAGSACVDDKVYRLESGMALLLAPGSFHYYFDFAPEGFTWLFFTFDLGVNTGLSAASDKPRRLTTEDMDLITEAGNLYTRLERSESEIFEIGLRMGRLLQRIVDRPDAAPVKMLDEAQQEACDMLRKVTHFVDQRMDQALRINDLADHLGVSESNLRKLFRERFGLSLGNYLRRSRLTRSVQLINRPDMSVSEVARLCGFESIYSFSQAFRRAIGMPPSAYRRHLAEGLPPITPTMGVAEEATDLSA